MQELCSADQDSVRLLAVQCCGSLARTLNPAECQSTVVPIVQRFAQVRRMFLKHKHHRLPTCLASTIKKLTLCILHKHDSYEH